MNHAATYRVQHDTLYDYDVPVPVSQQMLHLSPRPLPWQTIVEHAIDIDPVPAWRQDGVDAFGNRTVWISDDRPQFRLHVRSRAVVQVRAHAPAADRLRTSAPWEAVRQRLGYRGARQVPAAELYASRFVHESPHVPVHADFAAFAQPHFAAGVPVLAGAAELMQRIQREFRFDSTATSVSTPVRDVLRLRRGVCQDFAHLMIAALRSLGLAALYVSGYLLTHPPAGRPRLVGADASHAWVGVWSGDGPHDGWVAFDPTNDVLPDTEHITLAFGRDFSDISPMRGIVAGGGDTAPAVGVTVTPLA